MSLLGQGVTKQYKLKLVCFLPQEIQALKFLVKLKAGEAKMRERKQEEDFIPQNRRRFLFDDKVIRLGASLSEVLKAQVHVSLNAEFSLTVPLLSLH